MLLGTDIVAVERVRRLLEVNTRARERLFAPGEILYCESRGRSRFGHFAARFAAKEAAFKALGTGWRGDIAFCDLAVLPGRLGRPTLHLPGPIRSALDASGLRGVSISLTHDATYASATVAFFPTPLRQEVIDVDVRDSRISG